jgi:hypothetical protein
MRDIYAAQGRPRNVSLRLEAVLKIELAFCARLVFNGGKHGAWLPGRGQTL